MNKAQEEAAPSIQRLLKGITVRANLQARFEAELSKNLSDLEKLADLLKRKKDQELYLPCPKLASLLRTQAYIYELQKTACK